MKNVFVKGLLVTGIVIAVLFNACKTQDVLTKARKSGVKMEYSFPDNYLNYKQVQNIDQEIDAMGQIIDIDIVSGVDYLIRKNASQGEDVKIDVKVNSVSMEMDVMGQSMDPDLTELNGKEFNMVVSKSGKEVDTHEADEIIFQTSPDERSSLGMIFNSIFPDLPENSVKLNSSWTSRDSIYFKDGDRYNLIVTNNTHTLNDFIEMDGVNVAEIKTIYEGYLKGKSYSQGEELLINGKLTGEGTWYFDFENGRLIKDETTGLADGKISMSMGEMSFKRSFTNTTTFGK
jgi:hypothetical protein